MNERIDNASGKRRFMTFDCEDPAFGIKELKLHFSSSEVAKMQNLMTEEGHMGELMEVFKRGIEKGQNDWSDDKVDDFVARHIIDLQKFVAIYMGMDKDKVEEMFEGAFEEGEKKLKSQ